MRIEEITSSTAVSKSDIDRFLEILLNREAAISLEFLEELIAAENSHLFIAYDENGSCVGMLTIGIYLSPTGKKAWIEDVVVDEKFQGKGIGKKLMAFAIDFVKLHQVSLLLLTSNPSRVAANKLYQKMGFQQKETNVYTMRF